MCARTHVHMAFTFAATGVRGNQRATRRAQRRAEVYKEESPHFPGGQGVPFLVSLTQLYIPLLPGTDCPVTCVGSRIMFSHGFRYDWSPLLSVKRGNEYIVWASDLFGDKIS